MGVKIIYLIIMCFLVSAENTEVDTTEVAKAVEEATATQTVLLTTTTEGTTTPSFNSTKKKKVKKWRRKKKYRVTTERNNFELVTKKRNHNISSAVTKPTRSTTTHPYFRTRDHFYFFEGVDYEFTNDEFKKEHTDCYGEFIRCMRSRVTFEPVCAIDKYRFWYNEDFDNICQLELYNCNYRVQERKQNPEGVDYISSNRYYYIGDWLYCNPDSLNSLTDEQRAQLKSELHGMAEGKKLKTIKTTTTRTSAKKTLKKD